MAHRILVPLDGSDLASQVLPWADELAVALQADVDLLRVIQRDLAADELGSEIAFNEKLQQGASPVSERARAIRHEALEQEARLALSGARSKFQRAPKIDLSVASGFVPESIVAHAYQTGATLIAMASHGRTGLARTVLGSVAGGVIRDSVVPVLVVRDNLLMPPHVPERVLIPLDMSDLAEAALHRVTPLARELGWKLVLFSAAELPPQSLPIQGASVPLGWPPAHAPAEHLAYLERLVGELRSEGVEAEAQIGTGDPADAIVGAADRSGVGFIVMSTHGRRGLGRWLHGSVTEAVVGRATVPVLVIRPSQLPQSPAALQLSSEAEADGQPISLTLNGRQARIARLALEHLAWSASRHEGALEDIRGVLAALDAALLAEEERP